MLGKQKITLDILPSNCSSWESELALGPLCSSCVTYYSVWIHLSIYGMGWKKRLMVELSYRVSRCFLILPSPLLPLSPPVLGAAAEPGHQGTRWHGDLRGSQTSSHSSPKNVLSNAGPINLFYLALLEKKNHQNHKKKKPHQPQTVCRQDFL